MEQLDERVYVYLGHMGFPGLGGGEPAGSPTPDLCMWPQTTTTSSLYVIKQRHSSKVKHAVWQKTGVDLKRQAPSSYRLEQSKKVLNSLGKHTAT